MSDIFAIGWASGYVLIATGALGVAGSFVPTPNFTPQDDRTLRERAERVVWSGIIILLVMALAARIQDAP